MIICVSSCPYPTAACSRSASLASSWHSPSTLRASGKGVAVVTPRPTSPFVPLHTCSTTATTTTTAAATTTTVTTTTATNNNTATRLTWRR